MKTITILDLVPVPPVALTGWRFARQSRRTASDLLENLHKHRFAAFPETNIERKPALDVPRPTLCVSADSAYPPSPYPDRRRPLLLPESDPRCVNPEAPRHAGSGRAKTRFPPWSAADQPPELTKAQASLCSRVMLTGNLNASGNVYLLGPDGSRRCNSLARTSVMTSPAASFGRRILPVLLLLCLMTWVQAAASSPDHERHHLAGQGCLLCLAGPLPFVKIAPTAVTAPIVAIHWIEPSAKPEPAQSLFVSTRSSRAPPAEFPA